MNGLVKLLYGDKIWFLEIEISLYKNGLIAGFLIEKLVVDQWSKITCFWMINWEQFSNPRQVISCMEKYSFIYPILYDELCKKFFIYIFLNLSLQIPIFNTSSVINSLWYLLYGSTITILTTCKHFMNQSTHLHLINFNKNILKHKSIISLLRFNYTIYKWIRKKNKNSKTWMQFIIVYYI